MLISLDKGRMTFYAFGWREKRGKEGQEVGLLFALFGSRFSAGGEDVRGVFFFFFLISKKDVYSKATT